MLVCSSNTKHTTLRYVGFTLYIYPAMGHVACSAALLLEDES